MYTLKQIAQRGTAWGGVAAFVVAAVAPLASPAFADSLNPLTDRSLTLSSSAPGWENYDGSGNDTYAQPNSGANGGKTGNTFDFKVSSSATVKGMTFQYCTTSAGECRAPGDNAVHGTDTDSTSDLKVVTNSPAEVSAANFDTVIDTSASTVTAGSGTITTTTTDGEVVGVDTAFDTELQVGDTITTAGSNSYTISAITDATHLTVDTTPTTAEAGVTFTFPVSNGGAGEVKAVPGFSDPNNPSNTTGQFAASQLPGNFVVYYNDAGTWTQSSGWTMTASNLENSTASAPDDNTGQNNYITLANSTGTAFTAGQQVKVVFFGTDDNYIQNPGSGAFFVKINTYSTETPANMIGEHNDTTPGDTTDQTVIDGGVTVANVMNHSIRIQTKVLETMKFSVGTVDPNTLDSTGGAGSDFATATGATKHTVCDPIVGGMDPDDPVNVLKLGNQSAESSLSDSETYATHSFWRLSSNSSAGATVYYSGVTLSNTVGDKISAIGTDAQPSLEGSEQFGIGLMNNQVTSETGDTDSGVDYTIAANENGVDNSLTSVHASLATDVGVNDSWHTPRLYPLVANTAYANGSGTFQQSGTASFAFDETSNSVPVALATEDNQVVDCVTGKMRYIANIASTTPAGIYTTAVNYIAAPQY